MIQELPSSCPFCGSVSAPPDLDGDDVSWVVVCPDCGGRGPTRSTRDDAVAAWNRRIFSMPLSDSFGEMQ